MAESTAAHDGSPVTRARRRSRTGAEGSVDRRAPATQRGDLATDALGPLEWTGDPVVLALDASELRRRQPSDPEPLTLCTELGRRLLLTQFQFSRWVLRRVEKVEFVSDRRIARSSSIELRVPREAPVIQAPPEPGRDPEPPAGGRWLIPLTVMRRRTLVNLDLQADDGTAVSMLGLRFTQALDESMLRAAARLARPEAESHADIDEFIRECISGRWGAVRGSRARYENWRTYAADRGLDVDPLAGYLDDQMFRATLERLWQNFTLYVTLPVAHGPHRRLRIGFEERLDWRYRRPNLRPEAALGEQSVSDDPWSEGSVWSYKPLAVDGTRHAWGISHFFGWRPARVRFLVPSAENCASYHFEFTAPPDLWITEAALVAGRPNLPTPGVTSWDAIDTAEHSVGLHAVEIPNGSLCRAQVHLRVPTRGWLSTLLASCWAAVLALAAVTWHARLYGHQGHWTADQVTNMVVVLTAVTAGGATFVAQHPAGPVAARMVTGLRICGALAITLPSIVAVSLLLLKEQTFPDDNPSPVAQHSRLMLLVWLIGVTAVAVGFASAVTVGWWQSKKAERRLGRPSPWDMTTVDRPAEDQEKPVLPVMSPGPGPGPWMTRRPLEGDDMTFSGLLHVLDFTEPAVSSFSAEGWFERYGWTDDAQRESLRSLLAEDAADRQNPTGCTCTEVAHPRGTEGRSEDAR